MRVLTELKLTVKVEGECGMDFCYNCPFLRFGRKLHFLKRFMEYFENVCSYDLMNKIQLKVLGFLAYNIRTKMANTSHLVLTQKNNSFVFWSLTTQSMFNCFRQILH